MRADLEFFDMKTDSRSWLKLAIVLRGALLATRFQRSKALAARRPTFLLLSFICSIRLDFPLLSRPTIKMCTSGFLINDDDNFLSMIFHGTPLSVSFTELDHTLSLVELL